jgi:hypothetical protein
VDASARTTGSPKHHTSRYAGRGYGAGLSTEYILKRVSLFEIVLLLLGMYPQACMLVCAVLLLIGVHPQACMLACMVLLLLLGVIPHACRGEGWRLVRPGLGGGRGGLGRRVRYMLVCIYV